MVRALTYDHSMCERAGFETAAGRGRQLSSGSKGAERAWFGGAWVRNGFHEDGLATGIEAARRLMAQKATILAAAE